MPATSCYVLPQPVLGAATTASTGTDRPASGTEISGQTRINESTNAAPVMLMDYYEDMFHEIAAKWFGEGAHLSSSGIEQEDGRLQQDSLQIAREELGLMYLKQV